MNALQVYTGLDGELTKAFYRELEAIGVLGFIAMNLFRAQKASERAKQYTRKYRGLAYNKKGWSLEQLARALDQHSLALNLCWGWGKDETQTYNQWVLYVELPTGQISFHSPARYLGPDYPNQWDGIRGVSAQRIVQFCQSVYDNANNQRSLL